MATSTNPKDEKLTAEIKGGRLVISIGVNVLAFAALKKNGGPLTENLRISDPEQFAKDTLRELNRESENGDTPFCRALDAAMEEATNQGSAAVRALKRKPREL